MEQVSGNSKSLAVESLRVTRKAGHLHGTPLYKQLFVKTYFSKSTLKETFT